MMTIERTSDNRLDISLSGQVNEPEMQRILDELLEKSEGMKDGLMYYTIKDFKMPTVGALAVEFGRLPKMLKMLGRFSRCAVVTDVDWIRRWSEIEGAVIPGLKIKGFEADEAVAAEAWLEKTPAA